MPRTLPARPARLPRTGRDTRTSRTSRAALVLAALAAAACADPSTGPQVDVSTIRPSLFLTGSMSVLRVCKDATSPAGTYAFTASAAGNANPGDVLVPAFSLTVPTADGSAACADVFTRVDADEGGDEPALVTIVESATLGTVLTAVTVEQYGPNAPIPTPIVDLETRTATIPVNAYHGALTTFFNSAVSGGCTYTQGWYKNRGEDALPAGPFFLSGQSYAEVLDTPPKKGNVYYILAHQYIAAGANVADGATPTPDVAAALAGSLAYFGVATPANPVPAGYTRSQLEAWATTLDDFNNGRLGPLHCD